MRTLASVLTTCGLFLVLIGAIVAVLVGGTGAFAILLGGPLLLVIGVGLMVAAPGRPRNPPGALYSDPLVSITDDEIVLERFYFPIGSPKYVRLADVERIEAIRPGLMIQWRIWGSNDLVTWWPCDGGRPGRHTAFILYKKGGGTRAGFTVEDAGRVKDVLRAKGLLSEEGATVALTRAPTDTEHRPGSRGMTAPMIALVLLAVTAWAQAAYYHPQLPETVASHFGPAGRADGWMGRTALTALSAIVPTFVGGLFLVIGLAAARATDRRDATSTRAVDAMMWFGCATVGFVLVIVNMAYRANVRGDQNIGPAPWFAALAYVLIILLGGAALARHGRHESAAHPS